MRTSNFIPVGLVFGVALCGAAFAAPATVPEKIVPAAPVAAVEGDCMKTGSDISALIDKGTNSPNISAARAVFQLGIMDCMEGDDAQANEHYREAKTLLVSEQKTLPQPSKH
jgi:hypothetical protein